MSAASANQKSIQAVLTECGCEKDELRRFAQEIVDGLSEIDPSGTDGLLDTFISELVLSAADYRRREQHRQRQAEGIAAAKARGVRFGRQPLPLPEDFDACHQAWRAGQLSLRKAAESCGMAKTAFHRAVLRKEQTPGYAG